MKTPNRGGGDALATITEEVIRELLMISDSLHRVEDIVDKVLVATNPDLRADIEYVAHLTAYAKAVSSVSSGLSTIAAKHADGFILTIPEAKKQDATDRAIEIQTEVLEGITHRLREVHKKIEARDE